MKNLAAYTLILLQLSTAIHYLHSSATEPNERHLFVLEYNEYCDPEVQAMILNPAKLTGKNFEVKLAKLEKLMEISPVIRLCNIPRHLNCSDKTYRCDCWQKSDNLQMVYDPFFGECRGIRDSICEEHSRNLTFFPNQDRPTISEMSELLRTDLQVGCIKNAECKIGYQYIGSKSENEMKHCACKPDLFEPFCNHPTSNFTKILQVKQTWDSTICEPEISEAFDFANKNMWDLERMMILKFHQAKCNKVLEDKLDEIIGFWQNVSYEWSLPYSFNITRNKEDLLEFNIVGNLAQEILDFKPGAGYGLCNRFLGLYCDDRRESCKCPKGSTLQEGRCKSLAGQKCDLLDLPWNLPCVKYASCVENTEPDGLLEGICQCDNGESTPVCRRNIKNEVDHDYDYEPSSRKRIVSDTSRKGKTGLLAPISRLENNYLDTYQEKPEARILSIEVKQRFQGKAASPVVVSLDLGILSQLRKLLVEIIYQRSLPVTRRCIKDNVTIYFYEIVNQVSEWYKNQIPMKINISTALLITKEIFNRDDGTNVPNSKEFYCNPTKFLVCTGPGICECDTDLELSDGKCRLPIGAECTTNPSHLKRRQLEEEFILSVPRCIKGTTCYMKNSTVETCTLDEDIENNANILNSAQIFQFIMVSIMIICM